MTTYILHGGETKRDNVHNRKFLRKMLSAAGRGGIVLVVYFAKIKKRWPEMLKEDQNKFRRVAGKKPFELVLASDNLKIFKKQLAKVKSVYIRGGSDPLLQRKLKKVRKNLPKLFSGKTIAGSSAGADLISKYFYSIDTKKIESGFGILPIKIYAHYKNDRKNLRMLEKYKEELRIYTIPETESIVLKNR